MKRWLITGCAGGLGRALAEAALARGDHVAGTSRSAGFGADLAAAAPDRWHGLQLDITDPVAVRAAIADAARRMGGLDVVVNNAGYALAGAIEEIGPAEAQAQLAANLFGALYVMQASLPILRAAGGGRIINIASMAALQGSAGLGLYAASKWALAGLSEALAQEVSGKGIHVTVVEPSGFRTNFAGSSLTWATRSIAEYGAFRAEMQQRFARSNGRQGNDPAKGATALLALADLAEPPAHFALGFDAAARIRQIMDDRWAEYVRFAALGAATAFS